MGMLLWTVIVASFTDAWIETKFRLYDFIRCRVASFTDAWIETWKWKPLQKANGSHLLQMRGLKRRIICRIFTTFGVASFTDAWIETFRKSKSRQTRVVASFTDAWIETYSGSPQTPSVSVASFTDAWIETNDWCIPGGHVESHLLQMRGLKLLKKKREAVTLCRIFYRCVDWNITKTNLSSIYRSRIFYRCVDWNPEHSLSDITVPYVASFTDAWIETKLNFKICT